jgi:DHA1 family bicyclomycin/chloramphenicol resistance-like MFS transporter
MRARFLQNAIILGLLSAMGPFAIDMYLPSLPSIGATLGASTASVQLTLTVFFVAMSVGQLLYGTLSDMYGRKPPLYLGLVVFALGSIGCALSPNIGTLIVFRFIQGLGACGGMVIPRAVVRDLHTGIEATRLMSLLMLVFSVSPLLAPLTGSFIIQASGWRWVFWSVLLASMVGLALLTTLRETRPPEDCRGSTFAGALAAYRLLLADRRFMALTLLGSLGSASFFIYLANSPFVLIEHYHLSPRLYSVAFSVNALSFFGAAQMNAWLAARYGLPAVVRQSATGYAAAMLALLALFASGVDRLEVLAGLLFIGYGFLGVLAPTSGVLALEEHGESAGAASALMGTVQFASGSLIMALVAVFANGTALPMVAGIGACAALAAALAHTTMRAVPEPEAQVTTD